MRRLILRGVVALGALIPLVATAQDACKAETKLPAVSDLLDSASLIKNLPPPDQAAAKELFVRVTTEPVPGAVVLDSASAKTQAGRVLVERILTSLKPNAKSLLPAFRLRIRLSEAPALAVLPAIECPPPGTSSR